jgi:hypothetical protein
MSTRDGAPKEASIQQRSSGYLTADLTSSTGARDMTMQASTQQRSSGHLTADLTSSTGARDVTMQASMPLRMGRASLSNAQVSCVSCI